MKSYSYLKYGILTCLVIFFAAAGSVANAAEPNAPAKTSADPNKTGVAVTVNGVDISEAAVDTVVAQQLGRMKVPEKMPPGIINQYKRQIGQQVLERMVVEQLLDEEVKKNKIVVIEEDVIAHLEKSGAQQQPPLSLKDIKALIEAQGRSFDELKQQLQNSKGLKYQKLMEAQWTGKINFTEEDAKKYYSTNKKEFETPEQVKASHILVIPDTDPNTDPNQAKAKAKTKAEDLLRQIKDGADFATLAKARSDGPSGAKGGDLGFFSRGQMVPAFEKVAFQLKVGQVSDIVETRFGYHIIRVTDHKDSNVITFEQARDDIINRLTQQKQRELSMQYVESLKAKAKIVYPPGKEPRPARQPSIAPPTRSP